MSTFPVVTTLAEISPSTLSIADAPSSVYTSFCPKLIKASPISVSVGAVMSRTSTTLVTGTAALPALSDTL